MVRPGCSRAERAADRTAAAEVGHTAAAEAGRTAAQPPDHRRRAESRRAVGRRRHFAVGILAGRRTGRAGRHSLAVAEGSRRSLLAAVVGRSPVARRIAVGVGRRSLVAGGSPGCNRLVGCRGRSRTWWVVVVLV